MKNLWEVCGWKKQEGLEDPKATQGLVVSDKNILLCFPSKLM